MWLTVCKATVLTFTDDSVCKDEPQGTTNCLHWNYKKSSESQNGNTEEVGIESC